MKKLFTLATLFLWCDALFACTNLIVTKGASSDGSAFLAYTNDAEYLPLLTRRDPMDFAKGSVLTLKSGKVEGSIPQASHTYGTIAFLMNEHQLSVGETTTTGRLELWNHSKFINYPSLMNIAVQRAKTAKEAVLIMTEIADKYGYASEGETFSLVDPNEAWILEMFGTGEGGEGAIWVAHRIPDGHIVAHANESIIHEFPLDDPENWLYSDNVISFAVEKGWYDPKAGKPFDFAGTYCPAGPDKRRYCASRVWSIFNRAAPSLKVSPDYARGVENADYMPLSIAPDKKIGLKDVYALIRDHYEGTPWDMKKGYDAGAYGNPNRYRPLVWKTDSSNCSWERPISTHNTAFSFVSQMRSHLPDPIGGVMWFGTDDSYWTCYTPIYCQSQNIPKWYRTGDIKEFSWNSAWWIFNIVSNYAMLRYDMMEADMQKVQTQLEDSMISQQKDVEEAMLKLYKKKGKAAVNQALTDYSVKQTDIVMERWTKLAYAFFTKYNDGYVKNEEGKPTSPGYSKEHYQKTLEEDKNVALPNWKQNKEDYRPY